jgi:hypothetical protein
MPSTSPRSPADVSVILIGHDQDVLIHGSIVSAERAAERARARGLSVELILLLRDPTPALARWSADRIGTSWRVLTSSAQDHGVAHNEAIAASRGRHIAWIDGWDLWSENWIEAAVLAAERAPAVAVWHPEAVVRFGQNFFSTQGYALLWQPDGAAGEIDYAALLDEDPYPTGPFAARSLFDEIPFPTEDAARGWVDLQRRRRRLSPRGRARDLPLPAHGPGQPAPVGAAASGRIPHRTDAPQQGAGSRRRTRKRLDRLFHLTRPSVGNPLEILQEPIAGEGVEFQIEFAVSPDHIQRGWVDFTRARPVRAHVLSCI